MRLKKIVWIICKTKVSREEKIGRRRKEETIRGTRSLWK